MEMLLILVPWSFVASDWLCRVIRRHRAWGVVATANPDVPTHVRTTPLLGGAGIAFGMLPAVLYCAFAGMMPASFIVSTSIVATLGVVKDLGRTEISPWRQLVIQCVAAAVLVLATGPLNVSGLYVVDLLLSVAAAILMINAWNMLDVADGLAAGTAVITFAFAGYLAATGGNQCLALFAWVYAAGVLGFLLHNRPPAKIFMGDLGSFPIGVAFVYIALELMSSAASDEIGFGVLALLFIVPLFEFAFTVIARGVSGRSPMQGNAQHASLLLLARGWRPGQLLGLVYVLALAGGLLAVIVRK